MATRQIKDEGFKRMRIGVLASALSYHNTDDENDKYKTNLVDLDRELINQNNEIVTPPIPFYKENNNKEEPAGYVIETKNEIIVAYHGTQMSKIFNNKKDKVNPTIWSNIQGILSGESLGEGANEVVNDLDIINTGMAFGSQGSPKIHEGFKREYRASQDSLYEILDRLDKSKPLMFTGHSLGGAVAKIAALDSASNRGSKINEELIKSLKDIEKQITEGKNQNISSPDLLDNIINYTLDKYQGKKIAEDLFKQIDVDPVKVDPVKSLNNILNYTKETLKKQDYTSGRHVSGVYSFGAPRCFSNAAAKSYEKLLGDKTFRIAHPWDWIAKVPPWPLFAHVGQEIKLDANMQGPLRSHDMTETYVKKTVEQSELLKKKAQVSQDFATNSTNNAEYSTIGSYISYIMTATRNMCTVVSRSIGMSR